MSVLSAHAQLGSDSRSNSEVTFDMYEIIGDLYELKYENRMLVEKVETLEGQTTDQAEEIETLERIAAEGKLMAEKIPQFEVQMSDQADKIDELEEIASEVKLVAETIEKLGGQMSDQVDKIELLEEMASEGKLVAEKIKQVGGQMSDQMEKIEMLEEIVTDKKLMAEKIGQLEGQMSDQGEQIEKLNWVIESQKTSLTKQAEAIEILKIKLEKHTEDRHAFQVLRAKKVYYKGYNFLALEVRVPADGLSRSPNWCYDYQYLCDDFNMRPTGCGGIVSSSSRHASCRDKYNSNMDNGNVLTCHPSGGVAAVANIAFPNLSPPAQIIKNAFGFLMCGDYCSKTLQDSDKAVTYMRGFWQSNMTKFYTVCL